MGLSAGKAASMKQYLHTIDYVLWALVILGQVALLAGCLKRRLASDVPRFVVLIGFLSFKSVILIFISLLFTYKVYFYSYYSGVVVREIIQVAVAYEIFLLVFEPRSALPPRTLSRMIPGILGITILAAGAAIWRPLHTDDLTMTIILTAERSAELVICFSFWLLVLCSRMLGIPWKCRIADIASGFLVQLTAESAITILRGVAHTPYLPELARLGTVAYLGCMAFWFAALRRQEPTFAAATRSQLLLLRNHMVRLHSEMDRLDALGIQQALSRALPPRGRPLRPQTFDELVEVLKAVEFPEYEPISYQQMIELRRGILHNCEWLLRFVRDQYGPLVNELDMLDSVETLQKDTLRVIAECRKVYFGFSRRARKKRMKILFGLYDEMRLATMDLCSGAQPYLIDDIAVAL